MHLLLVHVNVKTSALPNSTHTQLKPTHIDTCTHGGIRIPMHTCNTHYVYMLKGPSSTCKPPWDCDALVIVCAHCLNTVPPTSWSIPCSCILQPKECFALYLLVSQGQTLSFWYCTGKGLAPRDYSFANTKHNKAHQLCTYRTLFILTSLYTQQ